MSSVRPAYGAEMHPSALRAGLPNVILHLVPLLPASVRSKMPTKVETR